MPARVTLAAFGGESVKEYRLTEEREIVITNPQIKTIRLSELTGAAPERFSLSQNYPNPFNPATEIKYTLPKTAKVTLAIYNTLGQKVKTLVSQRQDAGQYKTIWDATDDSGRKAASGVYLYQITVLPAGRNNGAGGRFHAVKKLVLLR